MLIVSYHRLLLGAALAIVLLGGAQGLSGSAKVSLGPNAISPNAILPSKAKQHGVLQAVIDAANVYSSANDIPQAGEVRSFTNLKTKFCWVPPGTFKMGEQKAQVDVTLTKGFWLSQTEVTQLDWTTVMETTPWSNQKLVKDGPNYPAMYVSWEDASEFCKRITQWERRAGRLPADGAYALPTEAQWEYACRAGSRTTWCFGEDASLLGEYAWFQINAMNKGEHYAHEVRSKRANAWGLHDMYGNVHEWCQDWHRQKLPGGTNPYVAKKSKGRMFRGGSWNNILKRCRSASRLKASPKFKDVSLGFRISRVSIGQVSTGQPVKNEFVPPLSNGSY